MLTIYALMFALALAPVSVTPANQELLSWQGGCSGKMRSYAPGHPDNRRLVVIVSDETGASITESEIDLSSTPQRGQSIERTFVLNEGQVVVITAWIYGPKTDQVRGVAVGRAVCH